MKPIKLLMIVTAAALITFGLGGYALAFHEGGVAHCDGCHTMHNSENGQSIFDGGTAGTTGAHLTIGTDPGSVCLNCHSDEGAGRSSSYHVMSNDGHYYHSGGDFYWMTKTFTWTAHSTPQSSDSYNHGHNVIAADYGLSADPILAEAPGGIFKSNQLYCSSCHDPHGAKANKTGPIVESGSYGDCDPATTECGNYRLLGDVGYKPGGVSSGVTFVNPPPIATSTNGQESDTNHTSYGMGMAEWCGNCHKDFYQSTVAAGGYHRHPASNQSTLGAGGLDANYNVYVKTGDLSGTAADSYLALVPFERQISDPTDPLLAVSTTQGPTGSSNVMCLTCHRAHASAFPNSGKWDFETELPAAESHPLDSDGGAVAGDKLNSYYGRDMVAEFGATQRSFCNKCHLKD